MAEKPKKDLSIIRHGLDVLHNPDQADVDVIAVPGLGAHPRDSWKSMDGKAFNWLINEDGIRRDLRKARIMLYQYGSAWVGSLKVTQFLSGIAAHMLADLMVLRKECRKRPIVFIGHSMGGLVIAKVVCIADAQKEKFPSIFESISGSLFFGTPFHGAPVAAIAAMLSQVGTYMNQTVASKLLELMTPGNEALDELRMEFVRLSNRGTTKISLCCFWEIHETNASDFAGLDKISITAKIFNTVIPNSLFKSVDRDSASLEGVTRYGLEKNHRDLVRYESLTDEKFRVPREEIRSMVRDAPSIAKGRHNAARTIDREQYNSIMEVLEGINIRKHREGLKKNVAASSWLSKEGDYQIWRHGQGGIRHENKMDGLWIRGTQGRGKTGASIAALDDLDTYIRDIQDPNQATMLLAYFFCDSSKECGTAEELLKSIIRQLIRQQEALAIYTKNFVKSKSGSGSEVKTLASVNSVENLWLCLQEMLTDDSVGGVYFVINNLHALPESADGTKKLLGMLRHEMELVDNQEEQRVPIRWLITSQDTHSIRINLGWEGVRLVDLEDIKYEDSVKAELRKHAQKKVTALRDEKHYNKALAYFASSLIGKRAQNTQWIDITCQHLAGLSGADTAYEVRRVLEKIPQDLTELLNRSWLQILQELGVEAEKVKEMLRSLALSFDDPTDAELALLSGLETTEDDCTKIRCWAESCKPLLVVKASKTTHKITFLNEVVKAHLQQNGAFLLGLSEEEKRWQHGILSFRCYEHLADTLRIEQPQEEIQNNDVPEDQPTEEVPHDAAEVASVAGSVAIPTRPASAASALAPMSVAASQIPEEDELDTASNVGSVKGIDAPEASQEEASDEQKQVLEQVQATLEDDTDSDTEVVLHHDETANADCGSLDYAVRHWLHHASKATPEIAEELSQEVAFWGRGSLLRLAWIKQYEKLTDCYVGFDALDRDLLTGLHIAASFGFRQLVASLLANGHMDELNIRENMSNAPLHFAATYGRLNTVEILLNAGASYDDGIEVRDQTPLSMAAGEGHVAVMQKLLDRGADPKAESDSWGPVINNAIYSGSQDAVKLLLEYGATLDASDKAEDRPLAIAAASADQQMFNKLLELFADSIPAKEYSTALIWASRAGRLEAVRTLLSHSHELATLQDALESAEWQSEWDVVKLLLGSTQGLNCNRVLEAAVDDPLDLDEVLQAIHSHVDGIIDEATINAGLYNATDKEKLSTVQILIDTFHAVPDSALGTEYGNALTASAFDGTVDIARILIAAGADVNSSSGWALQCAAGRGHTEMVTLLLEHGADINAMHQGDTYNGTALLAAVWEGLDSMVELLLEQGADPDLGDEEISPVIAAPRNSEGPIMERLVQANARLHGFGGPDKSTALINAAATLPTRYLDVLLDAGADINLPDNDGDTALIVAARVNDDDLIRTLLRRGADVLAINKNGKNALQEAVAQGYTSCVEVLTQHISSIMATLAAAITEGNDSVKEIMKSAAAKAVEEQIQAEQKTDSVVGDPDPNAATHDETDGDETASHRRLREGWTPTTT